MLIRSILALALALQSAGALTYDLRPTLDALAAELRQRYIDLDVAERMVDTIEQQQRDSVYARLQSRAEIARELTAALQSVSHDKHVRVLDGPPPRAVVVGRPTIGRVEVLDGHIGYIEVSSFTEPPATAAPAISAAMTTVAATSGLIIDLRGNGGGLPGSVALLAAYVLDARSVLLGTIANRSLGTTVENRTPADVDGPRYGTARPVFVLVDRRTGSGAESFAYHLQALGRITVIGEQSAGAANPGGFLQLPNDFCVFVAVGRVTNPITGTNWEGTGVSPDILSSSDEALYAAVRTMRSRLPA
jgi:C-terminal processing protease CtpA/Prc